MRKETIGDCVLYCGDCREVLPGIASQSIDMIWTDPPFGHGNMDGDDLQAARVGVRGARQRAAEPIANDSGNEFDAVMVAFLDEAARVMNRDCCCCCCCMAGGGPNVTFARVSQWIDDRLAFFQAIVWDKSARGNGMGWRYRRNYEFVLVAHRKGGKLLWADEDTAVPNIVRHMPVLNRCHPNEKPLALVEDFIRWHAKPGSLILDPFMGSGTTIEACIRLDMRGIGIESDPKHFETALRRAERATQMEKCNLFKHPDPEPTLNQRDLFAEVSQ